MPNPKRAAASKASNVLDGIQQTFKPYRSEALARIRYNSFYLLVLVVATTLLPLPGLVESVLLIANQGPKPDFWSDDWVHRSLCIAEATVLALLLWNILESLYALNYPPPPLPPTPSRALKHMRSPQPVNTTPKFKLLSTKSSPQPQKPFAFSPSSSLSSSALLSGSAAYPPSPVSTPSRTLHYSSLSLSTSTPGSAGGLGGSTSTLGYSPSPKVSVYRAKGVGAGSVGRALDASYLGKLSKTERDEDEE
ncbi:hypothetical protein CC1G_03970 [Coprinopsis cinerea okayama7|uniref:Uncharacterized protein n=1 Tax=Coprinopsis cinerea (strain Okayama-7 / 130 / ATCC MYA-4618 / FGSC 9003) TaxID=240176 RepID=A8N8C3_COPC7|nr:hypothetical protein CC1G_03970 [Coprinopsis cinerea okayama7\|eukprot:XP_001831079.1 hypothetical protein CC1G_03970 [Coprinopsis cinerea okayama7\